MIEMDDAIRIVLENTRTIDTTRVGLGEVLGRVLAEEVRSDIDMPPFDKALMDGYALRGADIASASQTTPAILDVIEEIPAGNVPQKRVESGQASRIMTGAPMPEGADTVAMVEDTEADTDAEKSAGARHHRNREEHRPARAKMCGWIKWSYGPTRLYARPKWAFSPPWAMWISRSIANPWWALWRRAARWLNRSTNPSPGRFGTAMDIRWWRRSCERAGAQARYFGIVEDDVDALIQTIGEGLATCDVVALSGGVSAGDYDLVQDGMRDLGVKVLFDRIRMKPGKPLTFGVKGGQAGLWVARQSGVFCGGLGIAHAPCDKKNAGPGGCASPHGPHRAQGRLSTNPRAKTVRARA